MFLGSQNERKTRTFKQSVSDMLGGRNLGAKNLKKKEDYSNHTV